MTSIVSGRRGVPREGVTGPRFAMSSTQSGAADNVNDEEVA
jgi:hypothetical protein